MSSQSLDPTIQDPFRSSAPLSLVADSNDEVDKLSAVTITPEGDLVDYNDDESDLTPLNSSDEEARNIDTTPRSIKNKRTSRPRVARASTSTVERAASSPEGSSPHRPPSPVGQPAWTNRKRRRTEHSRDKTPSTTQVQKPKPGSLVSGDNCHQCRNGPRYAFMRCTSNDQSGRPCRKLFCVSCITKRYPDDISFDPQLGEWKCPFCKDMCNCTKCCCKRNVKYISTSNVKIDRDTLLYYASLMPGNSNSDQRLPSPRSSKSAKKKLKSAKKSKAPARNRESIIRGLADTAAMFENFGCGSGEYWGVVFSNVDAGRIGVAYVGDNMPDILFLRDKEDGGPPDEPSPPFVERSSVPSGVSS